jgi:hypothetical protein
MLGHAAIGVMVGVLFVAAILALDIAGLRGLMLPATGRGGSDGAIALGLLLLGTTVTFGSAAMGAAIMSLGARPPGDPPSRRRRVEAGAVETVALVRARP